MVSLQTVAPRVYAKAVMEVQRYPPVSNAQAQLRAVGSIWGNPHWVAIANARITGMLRTPVSCSDTLDSLDANRPRL